MSGVIYNSGSPLMVDYTPGSAVAAGDVVVAGSECRIAHLSIEANQLGALAAPSGTAIYQIPKTTGNGEGMADGDPVYWNATTKKGIDDNGSGTHKLIGYAFGAAGDDDTTMLIRHST